MSAVFFGPIGDTGLAIAVDSCSRDCGRAADVALRMGAEHGSLEWLHGGTREGITRLLASAREANWHVEDWREAASPPEEPSP